MTFPPSLLLSILRSSFAPRCRRSDFGVYYGHEGITRAFAMWTGAWESLRLDVPDYVDAGDQVLVVFRQQGKV